MVLSKFFEHAAARSRAAAAATRRWDIISPSERQEEHGGGGGGDGAYPQQYRARLVVGIGLRDQAVRLGARVAAILKIAVGTRGLEGEQGPAAQQRDRGASGDPGCRVGRARLRGGAAGLRGARRGRDRHGGNRLGGRLRSGSGHRHLGRFCSLGRLVLRGRRGSRGACRSRSCLGRGGIARPGRRRINRSRLLRGARHLLDGERCLGGGGAHRLLHAGGWAVLGLLLLGQQLVHLLDGLLDGGPVLHLGRFTQVGLVEAAGLVVHAGLPVRLRDVEEQRRERLEAVDDDVLLGGVLVLAEVVVHLRLCHVLARVFQGLLVLA